jgi:hypothetical protein
MTEADMIDLIRGLLPGGSPPVVSPPAPAGHMRPADVSALLRTAFRVWVTDVRPELLASGRNCAGGPPLEDCILLARVDLPVEDTAAGLRVAGPVQFDESERPYLLHTRLLQEHLRSCCAGFGGGGGGGPFVPLPDTEAAITVSTFVTPIALAGAARVRRRIDLPAGAATTTYPNTTRLITFRSLPAVRFSGSGGPNDYMGTAVFDLRLPDDRDPTQPMRVRLVWSFDVTPPSGSPPTPPAPQFDYRWELRNHFFAPGDHLPQTLGADPAATFSGTVPLADEFNLLVTDFQPLPSALSRGGVVGALHVRVARFDPPDARLFLVKAELDYVANRLGRALA